MAQSRPWDDNFDWDTLMKKQATYDSQMREMERDKIQLFTFIYENVSDEVLYAAAQSLEFKDINDSKNCLTFWNLLHKTVTDHGLHDVYVPFNDWIQYTQVDDSLGYRRTLPLETFYSNFHQKLKLISGSDIYPSKDRIAATFICNIDSQRYHLAWFKWVVMDPGNRDLQQIIRELRILETSLPPINESDIPVPSLAMTAGEAALAWTNVGIKKKSFAKGIAICSAI